MPLLLAASAPAAGEAGRYDAFFPLRLGDSWTYDWRVSERGGRARSQSHTRTLEATEFVGSRLAFRFVGDDGSYEAYSLVDGALAIHGVSERGRILSFDPPVTLLAPAMDPGDTRTTENAETQRRFRATLLGYADTPTPLGLFPGCIGVRLETEGAQFYSDATYHYFPGVGLVAFRYELRTPDRATSLLSIEARLALARLAGVPVTSLADVAAVTARDSRPPGRDDPAARAILKRAVEHRYTWDAKFPGVKGRFEYSEDGKPPQHGGFEIDRELNVRIQAPSEAVRAALRNQLSSFVAHRRARTFESEYAETVFRKGSTTGTGEVEVLAEGDTMGTRYLVRRDEITSVGRSVGRLRYETRNLGHLVTEDGRTIAVDYEIAYYSNEDDSRVSSEATQDRYLKLGGYWVPAGRQATRTERGKPATSFRLELSDLQLL